MCEIVNIFAHMYIKNNTPMQVKQLHVRKTWYERGITFKGHIYNIFELLQWMLWI